MVVRNKLVQALTVGVALATLAACGSDDSGSSDSGSGGSGGGDEKAGGVIGVSVPGNNEYTQCMATGVIHAAKEAGYTVELTQGDFTDQNVIQDFQQMISKGVKGIVVLPNSDQSVVQGTLLAEKAGIPVANAGWFGETDADDVFAGREGVDVDKGVEIIAQGIEQNAEPGEVVFISGAPGIPTSDAFEEKLGPAIDALGGGWSLVETQPGFYVRDKAITAVQSLLAAHPDATTVVALSADMADGAATYLEQEGRDDITLISGDGNLALQDRLDDGSVAADMYFGAADQGEIAVGLLTDFFETGEKNGDLTDTPLTLLTKDNFDEVTAEHPLCYEELLDQASNMS